MSSHPPDPPPSPAPAPSEPSESPFFPAPDAPIQSEQTPPTTSDSTLSAAPSGVSIAQPQEFSEEAGEKVELDVDGWPKDPQVVVRELRRKQREARGRGIEPPTPPESELSLLTSVLEHRRLNRRTSLDLLDERSKHKFRMEVIEMARKELKARRGKLEGLKKRFGGVVKANVSRTSTYARKAEVEHTTFLSHATELSQLQSIQQALEEAKSEREGMARSNEKFLGFLERLADDPRFPTPESAISHFLNLLDTQAVLSERFAESEERRGAAEEAIVSLASEHDEKPDEAAMLRAEIEGTKSETAKLESEVAGLLEKHGPLMSKITDSKTRITALSTALEQRTSLLLGTGPSTATSPLEQLDSILGRVRELDELMEKMRQGQQRRQSRPATAKSRAQSAGRKSRPIG